MESQGREDRKDNDSFFTSSLIDYIARKTKNKRTTVVRMLGEKEEAQIPTGKIVYAPIAIRKVYIVRCGQDEAVCPL